MGDEVHEFADGNIYICKKTGARVPVNKVVCPAPSEPCKYRLNCVIYELYQDDMRAATQSRVGLAVTFLPYGKTVQTDGSETLLDAARRAGVFITSPCGGEGTCGKCKLIVRKGRADCAVSECLTDEERRQGYALACQSRAQAELVVEVPPEAREGAVQALYGAGGGGGFEAGLGKDPLVVPVGVCVEPPSLEDPTGDVERVCQAVSEKLETTCGGGSLTALQQLPSLLRTYDWRATVYTQSQNGYSHAIKAAPPDIKSNHGLAIDVGTTTVAVQLIDLASGRIVGTRASLNRQAAYGDDVLTRIIHACESKQGLESLHNTVIRTINNLIAELCAAHKCAATDIHCAVCAGNSTMIHLLLGIAPCTIRREPFVSVTNCPGPLRADEIGLNMLADAPVACVPGVSGYVGGDITAGVLASGLHTQEAPCALIDIGTNGEIVVGNRDWLICCASSAGPAFEGGGVRCGMRAAAGAIQRVWIPEPGSGHTRVATIHDAPASGICGSGLIDAIAELMRAGYVDRSGKITDSAPETMLTKVDGHNAFRLVPHEETGLPDDIVLTEPDIAHAIRSKGAVFTALCVLVEKVGLSLQDVSRFYVAGGFGNYLNVHNAVTIGLLPDLCEEQFRFIGNAALHGAAMALSSKGYLKRTTDLARAMTYVELSAEPSFMDRYVASLFLPHTDETLFPSITQELSGAAANQVHTTMP